MRTSRSRYVVLTLLVVVLGGVGVNAFAAQSAAPGGGEVGEPSSVLNKSQIGVNGAGPAGHAVTEAGQAQYRSIFAGIHLDDMGNSLIIHLTKDDSEAKQVLQGVALSFLPESRISFEVSKMTLDQQDQFLATVTEQMPSIESRGIFLTSWSVDLITKRGILRALNASPEQLAYLEQQYGEVADALSVGEEEKVQSAAYGRENDSPPWYGGAFIRGPGASATGAVIGAKDCTLGIPTRAPNGGTYLVTAAHCFAMNQMVKNNTSFNLGNNNDVGLVTNRDGANGGLDAELIFASGGSRLWTGYTLTTQSTFIYGAAAYQGNDLVCHSGAFEGETCDFQSKEITCINLFYTPSTYVSNCGEVRAISTNNNGVGEGDSGGPVMKYYANGSQMNVTGIVSAANFTIKCRNWSPQSDRQCGPTMFYVNWEAFANKWGLRVPA